MWGGAGPGSEEVSKAAIVLEKLFHHCSSDRTVYLGLRISGGEFPPDMRAGPIHLGAITCKHLVPVHRAASHDGLPVRHLLWMRKDFFHVVAGAESQLLQRPFERHRPRPTEAGTNHLQRHRSLLHSSGGECYDNRRRPRRDSPASWLTT